MPLPFITSPFAPQRPYKQAQEHHRCAEIDREHELHLSSPPCGHRMLYSQGDGAVQLTRHRGRIVLEERHTLRHLGCAFEDVDQLELAAAVARIERVLPL